MTSPILLAEDQGIQQVRFNRRPRLNAYDFETARQLLEALERCAERADIGAVLLEGDGPFCSGHDFEHFWRLQQRGDVEAYRRLQETLRDICLLLPRLPQLVVAVVEGTAASGGCTLALLADCRIAGPEAAFGHPATPFGFPVELGGTAALAATAGTAVALEVIVSGRLVASGEAARRGLAELHQEPRAVGLNLARRAAALSWESRRRVKRAACQASGFPDPALLERELDERIRFFLSDECAEAFARLEEAGARPPSE